MARICKACKAMQLTAASAPRNPKNKQETFDTCIFCIMKDPELYPGGLEAAAKAMDVIPPELAEHIENNSEFAERLRVGNGQALSVYNQPEKMMPAKEIAQRLGEYVIGQEDAKRLLATEAHLHRVRQQIEQVGDDEGVELEKANILLIGPTGTGKTYIAEKLAEILGGIFVRVDASELTEAGYVGGSIEAIPKQILKAAGNDVRKAESAIVFVDEIDKKREEGGHGRDVSGASVQRGLLKIIEGGKDVGFDLSKVLFIFAGSFAGIEPIIEKRIGAAGGGMGFNASVAKPQEIENVLKHVTTEDLLAFGMIPELIGRLPVRVVLDALTVEDLVRILTEAKDSQIRQAQVLAKAKGVHNLQFTDEAIELIAKQALAQKTGARSLKGVIRRKLSDFFFDLASDELDGKDVVIDVNGEEFDICVLDSANSED